MHNGPSALGSRYFSWCERLSPSPSLFFQCNTLRAVSLTISFQQCDEGLSPSLSLSFQCNMTKGCPPWHLFFQHRWGTVLLAISLLSTQVRGCPLIVSPFNMMRPLHQYKGILVYYIYIYNVFNNFITAIPEILVHSVFWKSKMLKKLKNRKNQECSISHIFC